MRIRKNRNLSSLLLLSSNASSAEDLGPTHFVCQLNQSPWDVIPFSSSSSSSSSSPYPHQQFGRDDNGLAAALNGCSFIGSVGPIKSDEKPIVGFRDEGHQIAEEWLSGPAVKIECAKTDGKFWKCKREAKEGHHFCEHHILQLKSYGSGGGGDKPRKANGAGPGRARATRKKKTEPSSSSGSNQYYYYSGFGPLWGKKQGESGSGQERVGTQSAGEGISYVHFEEDGIGDEDDEGGTREVGGSKKRVRKPVKARSLKSLM